MTEAGRYKGFPERSSRVKGKMQCPACAARGYDTRGDNLAVYDDGHTWCFACGYRQSGDPMLMLKYGKGYEVDNYVIHCNELDFPDDYTRYLPEPIITWLRGYGITNDEIRRHKFGWSEKREILVMPIFEHNNDTNDIKMWQGRNFKVREKIDPETGVITTETVGAKYITKGPKSEIRHVLWPAHMHAGNEVIQYLTDPNCKVMVVEDLISAIKVSRVVPTMPLWGSTMAPGMIKRLADEFAHLGIWLDPGKEADAVRIAIRASQFLPTFVVTSTSDPKDYKTEHISAFIEASHKAKLIDDTPPF